MKLMHPLFSEAICFTENTVQVVAFENPAIFREMAADMIGQSEGAEGKFILSQRDKVLDCADHLQVVLDYFHLEKLERKVQNRLTAALVHTAQESMPEETAKLVMGIRQYLGKLATIVDYPVAYEESENLAELLKAMGFQVSFEGLPIPEALCEYLALHHQLLKDQCFVLVDAKRFFSVQELEQLYQIAFYQKWNLLLMESGDASTKLAGEIWRLYDADLCELKIEES